MRVTCRALVLILSSGIAGGGVLGDGYPGFGISPGAGRKVKEPAGTGHAGALASFLEKNGPDWAVYWDDLLDTPRFLAPLGKRPVVVEGPLHHEAVAEAARKLVDENKDLFGIASGDLLDPVVYDLHNITLAVFGEGSGGVRIRGACFKVGVDPRGRLAWVDSVLLREPRVEIGEFISDEEVLSIARRLREMEPGDLGRQILFPDGSAEGGIPGFSLEVLYPDGRSGELFFAADGKELGEVDHVMGYEGRVNVIGYSPDPENIFALAYQVSSAYPLPGVRVYTESSWEGITDESGNSSYESPWTKEVLYSYLEYAALDGTEEVCLSDQNQDGIRTLVQIFEKTYCSNPWGNDVLSKVELLLPEDVDPIKPNILTYNPRAAMGERNDTKAFELMVFHFTSRFIAEVNKQLNKLNMDSFPLNYFPLRIGVTYAEVPAEPYYSAGKCFSRICLTPKIKDGDFTTPTHIQHEYAHHAIYTIVGINATSGLAGDFMEGLADVMTVFKNNNPMIYCTGPNLLGSHGFMIGNGNHVGHEWRDKIGGTFWKIYSGRKDLEKPKVIQLFYQWLTQRRVSAPDQVALDPSGLLYEQLLIADDSLEDGDNDLSNGTPRVDWIKEGFLDWGIFDTKFIRGDADLNDGIDLTDVIAILGFLFFGETEVLCTDAMDLNDSGTLDISDPIALIGYLFLGNFEPAYPFTECGLDPTDDFLWCAETQPRCR